MKQETGGNSIRVLKEANKYLVVQCIMQKAPMSIDDVVQTTHLSRPTVLNILRELMDDGIVIKDGFAESTIGRSAALLNLNDKAHFALGIDFEFPAVRMAVANLKGQILYSDSFISPKDIGTEELKHVFYTHVLEFVRSTGIPSEQFEGAGIGISGVIDSSAGVSLNLERVKDWRNVPICEELQNLLRMPVFLRNDVHLLGVVERHRYIPENMNDFIYVAIRTGIGSVICQHGRAMRGLKGNAGFLGHTIMNPHGPLCCCGNYGCLETYAGQTAIVNAYNACSHEELDLDGVLKKASAGDGTAAKILSDAGFYFGTALANLIKILEIPDVIVNCSAALADSEFLESAKASMKSHITENLALDIRLHISRMPEEEYALGGCYLVFEHMFSKPKLALSLNS